MSINFRFYTHNTLKILSYFGLKSFRIKLKYLALLPAFHLLAACDDNITISEGCCDFMIYASCQEILDAGKSLGNGTYTIDPDGPSGAIGPFSVYCDMTTDGGGWTMVLAQFEGDPVTSWNEGIQGDYDPSLSSGKAFALNTNQIPPHSEMGIGKGLDPTFITYFPYGYTTGNIIKTSIAGANGSFYWIHRNSNRYYSNHNPEYDAANATEWKNTLTIEGYSGSYTNSHDFTWAFSPNHTSQNARGYAMLGKNDSTSESYAWSIWVRGGQLMRSCKEILDGGGSVGNGTYTIDPDGPSGAIGPFSVYCDMTTDGGGWTMVLAQFEGDPVTSWNEGIQGDYDPSLSSGKGFALNTNQIPPHSEMGVGKGLDPTFVTYFPYGYKTGNIKKTSIAGANGSAYWIHRNTNLYHAYHNPDEGTVNVTEWKNTLTIEGYTGSYTTGRDFTWAFSPNLTSQNARGYAMLGKNDSTSESYAWSIWVR